MAIERFMREEASYYFKSPSKKPISTQLLEMSKLARTYRFPPYHYIKSHLYEKETVGDVYDYVPPKLVERIQEAYNSEKHLKYVRDKSLFQEFFSQRGIPCIPTSWIVDADGIIRDGSGAAICEDAFLTAIGGSDGRVFVKPIEGSQGHGAAIVDFAEPGAKSIAGLRRHIIQPVLKQHDDLNALFANSLNTIRLDTFIDGEECHHNVCALRTGTGDMIVDNWAAGGIVIGVDLETGRLYSSGRRHNKFGEHAVHRRHPNTGVVFDGWQIPFWKDVKALARKAAMALPELRCLCWDIAVTPEGPILVEANDHWSVNMLQTAWGGIRQTRLGQEALRKHGVSGNPPLAKR